MDNAVTEVARDTAADNALNVAAKIDALVDEYRTRCLWSLRLDYYPRNDSERLRVLDAIERHGDLAAYRRVALLRQCLSRISSAAFAND